MSSKHKRLRMIDDYSLDCDIVCLRKTTYNTIKKKFKMGSMPHAVQHLRNIIYDGKYQGIYKKGDIEGHLFSLGDDNVVVSKGYNLFVSAFKTKQPEQPDSNISPEVKDDDNLSVVQLENENKIKIGENTYDINSLELSDHAELRVRQRFYITEKNLMKAFCLDVIKGGQYMGLQFDKHLEDGQQGHMFVKNSVILFICQTAFKVITLYEGSYGYYETVKELFTPMVKTKLNGAKRDSKKVERDCKYKEWEIREKIIQLEKRAFETRGKNVKQECEEEIETLKSELSLMEEDKKKMRQKVKDLKYLYGCIV